MVIVRPISRACHLMFVLLTVFAEVSLAGRIIYVDIDSPGANDGSSWAAAFKYLQDALAAANANDEIRVAQGTYVPDRSSVNPDGSGDREATFELAGAVAIYGGYAGYGEADPDDRDVEAYETILSGDLGGNDAVTSSPEQLLHEPSRSDNCYHVISSDMWLEREVLVLDGLTIAGGQADDIDYPRCCGGGIFTVGSAPILTDCTFKGNCARFRGGGAYNRFSHPYGLTISNCAFIGNCAGSGGGVFNGDAVPSVSDCAFTGNFASDRGGGMYNHETDADIRNCVLSNNSAANEGGGIYNHHGYPELRNCIISGNFAGRNGGGVANEYMSVWLTNCTIVGNEAGEQGGGVFDYLDGGNRYVTNCILWNNIAYEGPQMAANYRFNLFISHSCLQGGRLDIHEYGGGSVHWADGNNTDADPMFVDPGYWDMGTWLDGDYHLRSRAGRWEPATENWVLDANTSPCVDAGDPTSEWTAELWPHGKCVNMGAFGGSPQASMSESSLGNRADLDYDGSVNFGDFAGLMNWWQAEGPLRAEDVNRDAIVDFFDVVEFAEEWLWREI